MIFYDYRIFEKKCSIDYSWDKDLGYFKLMELTNSDSDNHQENK